MKPLYRFIHAAQQGRTKLSVELQELLTYAGFLEGTGAELATIYQHRRDILERRPNFNYV